MTNTLTVAKNGDTPESIPEPYRSSLKKVLVLYYSGSVQNISEACKQAGISRTTFYKYKNECPDEMEAVAREAREIALAERSDTQLAFDGEQITVSVQVQRLASSFLQEALPELARIAMGIPRPADSTEPEPEEGGKKKRKQRPTAVYARDQIEAFKMLQMLARGGVLPEGVTSKVLRQFTHDQPEPEKEELLQGPLLPVLPVSTQFTSVVAKTADGTTVSVKRGDAVDAEIVEVDDAK